MIIDISPSILSAPDYTTITVTGKHFHQYLVCKFGSKLSPKTEVISPEKLHCLLPPLSHPSLFMQLSLVSTEDGHFPAVNKLNLHHELINKNTQYISTPESRKLQTTPVITTIMPSSVVLFDGNVEVTLGGIAFHSALVCDFGPSVTVILTQIVSDSVAICTVSSPQTAVSLAVSVSLSSSDSGLPSSANSADFTFEVVPSVINDFSPDFGPANSFTNVTVTGLNFHPTLGCKFGDTDAIITEVVSPSVLWCLSPVRAEIPFSVQLSLETRDIVGYPSSTNSAAYLFQSTPSSNTLIPSEVSGYVETNVTVIGGGIHSAVACRFGGILSRETVIISATELRCVAPPISQAPGFLTANVELLLVSTDPAKLSASVAPFITYRYTFEPTGSPTKSPVLPPPIMNEISPSSAVASLNATSTVSIVGINFHGSMVCDFGASIEVVNSTVVSGSLVLCEIRSLDTTQTLTVEASLASTNAGLPSSINTLQFVFEAIPLRISNISPVFALPNTITNVTVTGSSFHSALVCKFGEVTALVTEVLSTSVLWCLAPARSDSPFVVDLSLASTDVARASSLNSASFTFQVIPFISVFAPQEVSGHVSTNVSVLGGGYHDAVACRFGGILSSETIIISTTELRCVAPPIPNPGPPGFPFNNIEQLLLVSTDANQLPAQISVSITYTYTVEPTTSPSRAPTLSPAPSSSPSTSPTVTSPILIMISPEAALANQLTNVTVFGVNFHDSLVCRFGGVAGLITTVLSDSLLWCLAPTRNELPLRVPLSLESTDVGLPSAVNSLDYLYQVIPSIDSINPVAASAYAFTNISVIGQGFHEAVVCQFGNVSSSETQVISLSELRCVAPPRSQPPLQVELSLLSTEANQVSSQNSVPFQYLVTDAPTTLSPTTSAPTPNSTKASANLDLTGLYVALGVLIPLGVLSGLAAAVFFARGGKLPWRVEEAVKPQSPSI